MKILFEIEFNMRIAYVNIKNTSEKPKRTSTRVIISHDRLFNNFALHGYWYSSCSFAIFVFLLDAKQDMHVQITATTLMHPTAMVIMIKSFFILDSLELLFSSSSFVKKPTVTGKTIDISGNVQSSFEISAASLSSFAHSLLHQ